MKHRCPRFLLGLGLLFSVFGILLCLGSPVQAHPRDSSLGSHLEEQKYVALIKELGSRYRFHHSELQNLFGQVELKPEILEWFEKPRESLPYPQYRELFINAKVIARGKQYLQDHRALFDSVEKSYNVDPFIIAAILGIESRFGRKPDGGFRVFDALNTTFAGLPRRESFARREIIEFLLLCREESLMPLEVMGSYAGALGTPQFIPSSYRQYAVDYDGDGKRDLWNSTSDIVASVANYLKRHGWERSTPIRFSGKANTENVSARNLIELGIKGKTAVNALPRMGIEWTDQVNPVHDGLEVSLISSPWKDHNGVIILFPNFRTIMRYNPAINYALAVTDLAEALALE